VQFHAFDEWQGWQLFATEWKKRLFPWKNVYFLGKTVPAKIVFAGKSWQKITVIQSKLFDDFLLIHMPLRTPLCSFCCIASSVDGV